MKALTAVFVSMAMAAAAEFPAPTGQYAVGTFSRHLVDDNREESLTAAPDDKRELMIQFWYPAEPAPEDGEPTRYFPDNEDALQYIVGPRAANPMGIKPADVEEHLRPLRTYSYESVPLADAQAKYPVLIFSHGFGGFRSQNTVQAEDMASHGYIVVGVDHTYNAAVTIFPDGRMVPFEAGADLRTLSPDERDAHMERLQAIWLEDVLFVADTLESIAAGGKGSHPLAGKVDIEKLGIYGHSFGGATAASACAVDARFKAGINMDGLPYGPVTTTGVKTPFLFVRAEREPPNPTLLGMSGVTAEEYEALFDEFDRLTAFVCESSPNGYSAHIAGTRHFNFTDFPFFAHLSAISKLVVGDMEPARNARLFQTMTRTFFDRHLLGKEVAMPGVKAEEFPELIFKAHTERSETSS